MNDTPETNKAERMAWSQEYMVETEFARKLERERDEAREALRTLAEHGESEIQRVTKERDEAIADLEFRRGLYKVLEGANNHLMTANQEVAKLARTLKQERDEARSELSLKQQTLTIAEGTLSDLRKQLEGTK